ncbi:relaxase/mobilization nuclease domain-containing protein [Sphingobacterium deserti]|uniref:Relaxase/mobilization nuclease family protein n=1 Tax=Sphingobacterium deserti TaxID=1229276 RepID=A0A0B8SZ73_9SPHI|nr:relaxase/mobilization nuclease domain-containing protein [Sphingobacterium deserti]KGE12651.1 relaxase/mobilization nuclease family protein [Sphingobacterium deserti]
MIVKFLRKSTSFGGVRYNTNKVDSDQGELLSTRNFDALQGLTELRPQDYINYLEAVSSMSSRIKYPQLHVVISAKGKQHATGELSAVAHDWMQGMGYGEQPYLVILHSDTANHHVHIVSTRVGKEGKKIDNSFEKIRAYEVLNEILGENALHKMQKDLTDALRYNFITRAQFRTLLENRGYTLTQEDQLLKLFKFGKLLGEVRWEDIDKQIRQYSEDSAREKQIYALIDKYRYQFDQKLEEEKGIFTSELTRKLALRFGLHFVFHSASGKLPYGYTIIDYSKNNVFKGSQVYPLARLMSTAEKTSPRIREDKSECPAALTYSEGEPRAKGKHQDSAMDKHDRSAVCVTVEEPLISPILGLNLTDDVDDEAVHGKKRNRQNKKSTKKR